MAADSLPVRDLRSASYGTGLVTPGLALSRSTAEPFAGEPAPPYFWLKRCSDLVLACLLLILLAPVMALIAIVIRLDSDGPAIFRQERMGYDWRNRRAQPFIFYKFRSMYNDCDQSVHQRFVQQWARAERDGNSDQPAFLSTPGHDSTEQTLSGKLTGDERVTRVGRVLRKSSLDELPQLWNVIKGDMSMVGPRPVPLYEVAEYEPWHCQRLLASPGLTGLWQVKGRGWVSLDQMAALDIEYIRRRSSGLDLAILLLTIPSVLSGRGAE